MTMKRPFLLAAGCCALVALAGCQSVNPETPARAGAAEGRGAGAATPPGVAAPAIVAAPPAPPAAPRPLRIALALGGGAARGFAHVGVIKALEARGIEPDIVVGTSVGGFVAALYAAGYAGADLQQVALQFEESAVTDWSLPSRGVFKGMALQDFVNRKVDERPIEKLPRKLAIVATDLGTGEIMVFERGNVGMAVRASSSVPGVFQPVSIGGHEYVDGGLVSPVPVRTARQLGADVVIAVDISKRPADQSTTGAVDILLQTFAIMGQVIGRNELQSADIVLRPSLGSVGSTDFTARESAIRQGEEAVAAQAAAIAAIVDHARQNLAGAGAAATP
jgi:NTE family protein